MRRSRLPRRLLRPLGRALLAIVLVFAAACGVDEEPAGSARERAAEALARGDREAALEALEHLRSTPAESAEALLELTALMARAGESPHALWLLEEGLSRFPERDDLRLQTARLALVVQDPTRALEALATIGADSPLHFDALLVASQAHFELGDRARGLESLGEAGRLYPDRSEARLAEIAALLQDERIDEARRQIAALRASGAIDAELARRLDVLTALLDAQSGNVDSAVAALEETLDRHPTEAAAWSALAQVQFGVGRGEELLALLERLTRREQDEPVLYGLLGQLSAAMDRREAALAAYLRLVELSDSPSARVALASFYSAEPGGAALGEPVLAEAVRRFPEAPMLHVFHAESLIELMRLEQAEAALEVFRAQSPRDPHVEYLRARLELARGDSAAAARRLRRLAPQLDRAYTQMWLARALEASGDELSALRRYGMAMQRDRVSPAPALAVARLSMRRGDWRAVTSAAEVAVQRAPRDIDAQALLLEALIRTGRAEQAEARARLIAPAFEGRLEPALLLSRALRAQGRFEEAEREATRALEGFPADPELLVDRALAIALQGRLFESIGVLETAAHASPERASVQNALALVHFGRGDTTAASAAVDRAFALEPHDPAPLAMRARYLASRGELEAAEPDLRRAIALRPDDATLRFLLGAVLEGTGRRDEAIAAYRRAAELDDRDFGSRNNLALLLEQQGDLDGALHFAQQAYGLAESDPRVVDTLGWLYLQKGLAARAVALLERARSAAPADASTQLHLALAYHELGRDEEARALLDGLIDRDDVSGDLRSRVDRAGQSLDE